LPPNNNSILSFYFSILKEVLNYKIDLLESRQNPELILHLPSPTLEEGMEHLPFKQWLISTKPTAWKFFKEAPLILYSESYLEL
jgi:hypothetical protein